MKYLAALILVLLALSCDDSTVNQPNDFELTITASNSFVNTGDTLQLTAMISDPENICSNKELKWTIVDYIGSYKVLNDNSVNYIAPKVIDQDMMVTIKVSPVGREDLESEYTFQLIKTDPIISFENDLQLMLKVTCTSGGCHNDNVQEAGLVLDGWNGAKEAVVPYKPEESILYLKIKDQTAPGKMPPAEY